MKPVQEIGKYDYRRFYELKLIFIPMFCAVCFYLCNLLRHMSNKYDDMNYIFYNLFIKQMKYAENNKQFRN